MSKITVAATQMACSWDRDANVARAEKLIREAARRGANVVLIQELFETPYFCKDHAARYFDLAKPLEGHPAVEHFRGLARELDVVLPVSVFERANNAFYNSVVMVDAGGAVLGSYRKSHIPEGPGYHEKFYFSPGDTGFKVFDTRFAKLGVAICWDQWFPEAARAMALMGAEILLYPTAIGSEPQDPSLDSSGALAADHAGPRGRQRHAAGRLESHRHGGRREVLDDFLRLLVHRLAYRRESRRSRPQSETVLTAAFDLDEVRRYRQAWGVFRDRRPDLYYPLLSLDGRG